MSSSQAEITGIGAIGVPALDHDRAIAFYTEALGFVVTMDAEFAPGMRWAELTVAGSTTAIALAPVPEGGQTGVDTGIRLATGDADQAHRALQAAGVDVDDEVMRWPGVPPMFGLRDSEGNTLYVVER